MQRLAAAAAVAGALYIAWRWRSWRQQPRRCASKCAPRLEVCADSVAACVQAQAGGAHRIELCDNLLEGGTTPSVGKLLCCRRHCALPVHVMLRPRGGDFLYTAAECEVIEADLDALKKELAGPSIAGELPEGRLVKDALIDDELERLRREAKGS